MVVKIQPPSNMIEATMFYNERKADGPEGIRNMQDEMLRDEDGHIVATENVPESSTLEKEFERLKLLNAKKTRGRNLEKEAFHMSVNPGVNDTPLSEAAIVELVKEMMDQLGYGDNPYRIYKHTDIEREHYHVVSTRIGQDGKKISDSFENKRINAIAEKLAKKYGYTVGLEENTVENAVVEEIVLPSEIAAEPEVVHYEPVREATDDKSKEHKFVPPFKKNSETPVTEQFKIIHTEAMSWSFTTPEQYMAILKWRFNIKAIELEDGIHFIGLDRTKETTNPISEGDLGINAAEQIQTRCSSVDTKKLKSQKKRIETYASHAIKNCPSLKEFRRRMNSKGIYVVISFTEDGQPFGLTWLDRATKCAFKGSETICNLQWLKNESETNGWVITQEHPFDKTTRIDKDYKSRYRIPGPVKKSTASQNNSEKEVKKMLKDKDERSNGAPVDKPLLNDDPNNIKI